MGKLKMAGFLGSLKFPRINARSGVVGIEIGSDWLKIAQKDRAKNGKVVYNLNILKLAQIKDSLASAIADSFRLRRLNTQQVVAYIPRHLGTVRMLELPATDPKEINDMIDLQVGKQTPYAKEEIVFAHKIVESGSSGYTKVMLAIVARNIVSERMETLVKAGLTVKKVVISSEGVCNWFREAYLPDMKLKTSQAIILIDVDSNYSDFIVMRHGKMVFTRNIFIGANHLMQEKTDWREKFLDELKRSLERYHGAEKSVEIAKVYLSGTGPNIPGLDEALSAAMEIRVENADPLKNFHSKSIVEGPRDENLKLVSMTQLLGVSLDDEATHMDLTPNEQKVQNVMDRKTKQLTLMGILVVAIVTAFSFLCLANIHTKNAYLTKLKKTISNIAKEAEGIDKMRVVIDRVEQRLDSRGSSLECLNEIYKVTPKEIYLTDIDIDEKQTVVLKGHGFAMSDVFKYVKMLEESNMFENVKTTYTRVKNEKDSEFAEFEINCAYQK
ncbi:MAG: pilus assembly protein PilM [Candidatus Omnitrophica bacterium]|nr:pilus assembly protein PilM [Candidatus Omnitrophota bacterium]